MHPRLSLLILLVATVCGPLASSVHAQLDPVSVTRVKFDKDSGTWKDTQIEVELQANGNPNPDAPNPNYVDNVTVTLIIGYAHPTKKDEREFIFHTSTVTLATLEVAKKKKIGFYLPYDIVQRDNVRKEPTYWYVNLEVDGSEIPVSQNNIKTRASSSLQRANVFQSFQNSSSGAIEGVLQPGYLSGNGYIERGKDRPAFIRKEEN